MSLTMFALSLALTAASAPQASAPPPPAATNDIVVKGRREREREIDRYVDALTPSRLRGQITRFAQPVCPGAIGLGAANDARVADRLRRVAAAVGAPLGSPGCKPNLLVLVADDKALLARRIRASMRDGRGERPQPAASGSAIVLHFEGELDANRQLVGIREESGDGRSGYAEVEVFTSDRIRPGTSPTFLAAMLIVEAPALAGLTTTQLADHAAMRLLARTDPARLGSGNASSILTALDAPADTEVPLSLTSWDFAFLKGLYASADRTYAGEQRRIIRDSVRKDLSRPR